MDVRKRDDTVAGVVGHRDGGLLCYIPLCADPKPHPLSIRVANYGMMS